MTVSCVAYTNKKEDIFLFFQKGTYLPDICFKYYNLC